MSQSQSMEIAELLEISIGDLLEILGTIGAVDSYDTDTKIPGVADNGEPSAHCRRLLANIFRGLYGQKAAAEAKNWVATIRAGATVGGRRPKPYLYSAWDCITTILFRLGMWPEIVKISDAIDVPEDERLSREDLADYNECLFREINGVTLFGVSDDSPEWHSRADFETTGPCGHYTFPDADAESYCSVRIEQSAIQVSQSIEICELLEIPVGDLLEILGTFGAVGQFATDNDDHSAHCRRMLANLLRGRYGQKAAADAKNWVATIRAGGTIEGRRPEPYSDNAWDCVITMFFRLGMWPEIVKISDAIEVPEEDRLEDKEDFALYNERVYLELYGVSRFRFRGDEAWKCDAYCEATGPGIDYVDLDPENDDDDDEEFACWRAVLTGEVIDEDEYDL